MPDAPDMDPAILESGVPILGICYGMQLVARASGLKFVRLDHAEYGPATLEVTLPSSPLFAEVPVRSRVWMSHGDTVVELPTGFVSLARTDAAVRRDGRRGAAHVRRAVPSRSRAHRTRRARSWRTFCAASPAFGATGRWSRSSSARSRRSARRSASDKVICALSGGVDSAVAATLVVARDRRTAHVHVRGSRAAAQRRSASRCWPRFATCCTSTSSRRRERAFLARARGREDPEEKRMIIGHEFIRSSKKKRRRFPACKFLVQGTLYPDVIESKTPRLARPGTRSSRITTSAGCPSRWISNWSNRCARCSRTKCASSARVLGLPEHRRAPAVPGAGLAVRIIGDVTPERLAIVREADAIVREEIDAADRSTRIRGSISRCSRRCAASA